MKLVRVFQCACSRASRSRRSTGVVLGSSGREVRSVVLRSNAPIALCSDIGPMLLPTSGGGMSGTPKLIALCLKQTSEGWSNFIDYRSRRGVLRSSHPWPRPFDHFVLAFLPRGRVLITDRNRGERSPLLCLKRTRKWCVVLGR